MRRWSRVTGLAATSGISRRGFLRRMLLLPAIGIPDESAAQAEPTYLLDRFYVAGFQYHDGRTVIGRIGSGDALELSAEPENAHDPDAVKISWHGTKLGYVPRAINGHIGLLLRQNAGVRCRVASADPGAVPWQMLEVEVILTAGER